MMLLRSVRLLACLIMLSVASVHANLGKMEVQFSPDAETFSQGESVVVTGVTDDGVSAEYRFVLLRYDGQGGFLILDDTGWDISSGYTLSDQLADQLGGSFKLVSSAREQSNPDETITNVQTFLYSTPALTECDWLDGKTFVSESPAEAPVILNTGSLDLLDSLQDLAVPLDTEAEKYVSLSFHDGIFYAEMVQPGRIEDAGGADVHTPEPFTGTYNCTAGTVDASGATEGVTSNCGGTMSMLGCPNVNLSTSGSGAIDMERGTVTAGGVVFRLQDDSTITADGGSGAGGAGGVVLLVLLLVAGVVRRRV